ncbi:hypothetical protein [Bradyrhizobium sp. MOS002]|uniref:hypothetical protein n=1 Tax=Bradyrhizobium sp. MOS002 TaxID=2133947 RepID=UPI0011B2611C|nr:hypothetical protein [Bradyrhizobium sp. MOS002]
MSETWRYSGDAGQAARLLAARTAAGFATAVDAAQRFGWSVARLRSHEGAARGMNETVLRHYAQAFSVSEEWLRDGTVGAFPPFRDKFIEVDPLRVQELELRLEAQRQPAETEDIDRGRRLRFARRLAGFRSAAAGGAAAKLHRSTVNAHERGVDGFDLVSARKYAKAFGCEPVWLIEGSLPSGYPAEIEKLIGQYLNYHNLDEDDAAARLPSYQPPPLTSTDVSQPELSTQSMVGGVEIPEFEIAGLAKLLTDSGTATRPTLLPGWSMPHAFLEGILRAVPKGCVMVVVPNRAQTNGFSLSLGDRLIVDTSVQEVFSAVYAAIAGDTLVIADAKTDHGKQLAAAAARRQDGMVFVGQIVGVVSALR